MPKLKTFFQSFIIFGLLFFTISSCSNRNIASDNSIESTFVGHHNSKNSLDWEGVYRGVLPCADCEGIQTEVFINYDSEFKLRKRYLGKSSQIFITEGEFTWDDSGGKIQLHNEDLYFLVGENRLIILDSEGNRKNSLSNFKYDLNKEIGELTNRKWYLYELNGELVEQSEQRGINPYIKFEEGDKVSGNASCNAFHGTFNISEGNRISFSQIALTRKICQDMQMEKELIQVFEQADNYHVRADTFQLNYARLAPLARFEYRFFD